MHTHKIAHHLINQQQDIQFYYTGTEQCRPSHSWGPGIKDQYKIHYVHSGKGLFRTGGQTHIVGAGQAFLMTPGEVASYQADQEDPWSYSWVAFGGSQAPMYLDQAGFTYMYPVIACDRDLDIRECLSRLFDANQRYYSQPLQMTSALYAFLAILLEPKGDNSGVQREEANSASYVSQAVYYMEKNYTCSFRMEEMAAALGLNRKYLTSLFKAAMGMPPQQYLCQLRMKRARSLLRETNLSIKEISYSVGYADQLLFSRMFKRSCGIAPKQYRMSLTTEED